MDELTSSTPKEKFDDWYSDTHNDTSEDEEEEDEEIPDFDNMD